MAWQAVAAAAGQAATGILGNVLNNRYAKKQLERQNAFNKEMWAMDNAYNSPKAQMARLREAGLNPNLVYGNGSVANQTKGPVKSDSFVNVPSPTGDLGNVLGDSLQTFQDVRMRDAQIDNINAQTQNTVARTATEGANLVLKGVTGKKVGEELRQLEGLWNFNVTAKDEEARQAGIRTDQMLTQLKTMGHQEIAAGLDNEYKRAGLTIQQIQKEQQQADVLFSKYRNELARLGFNQNDSVIARVIVRALKAAGIDAEDGFRGFFDGLRK